MQQHRHAQTRSFRDAGHSRGCQDVGLVARSSSWVHNSSGEMLACKRLAPRGTKQRGQALPSKHGAELQPGCAKAQGAAQKTTNPGHAWLDRRAVNTIQPQLVLGPCQLASPAHWANRSPQAKESPAQRGSTRCWPSHSCETSVRPNNLHTRSKALTHTAGCNDTACPNLHQRLRSQPQQNKQPQPQKGNA